MADPASYRPAPGSIPTEAGVYRFSDQFGQVIYVGKAKNLRNRLNSYFADPVSCTSGPKPWCAPPRGGWTVVRNEVEALQLEYTWIKQFDPRFNIKYRDDKSYPWLCVTWSDSSRASSSAGAKRKDWRYFGPFGQELGGPRVSRFAVAGVPDALLRATASSATPRPPAGLPRRLHRQVRGALRRPDQREDHREDRRGLLLVLGRPDQCKGLERKLTRAMRAAADARGVRTGGGAARRPGRPATGHREERDRPAGRHRCRCAGDGCRPAGVVQDLPCAGRTGARRTGLGGRPRRRGRPARTLGGLPVRPVCRRAGQASIGTTIPPEIIVEGATGVRRRAGRTCSASSGAPG